MDKELLKWGIENSDPEKLKSSDFDPSKIDPELVDYIIKGPAQGGSRPVAIKELVKSIKEGTDLEAQLESFENLHGLVEEIDHAISMENLGLWPDIISFSQVTENEDLRMWSFWTMSSAAHHNPKVQDALLGHAMLPHALATLESDASLAVRQKSMLLVSALVKQSTSGFVEFTKLSGIQRLAKLFDGEDRNIKDRIAFFLSHLFDERPRLQKEHSALYKQIADFRSD